MSSVGCIWKLWTVLVIFCFSLVALSVLWPSGLSSSDSEDELGSPSYASFLQYTDNKPFYSDVAKKQMVGTHCMINWSVLNIERRKCWFVFSDYAMNEMVLMYQSIIIIGLGFWCTYFIDKRRSICCPLFVVFSGKNGLQGRGTSWKVRINIQ